jgi:hypothetical protein
MFDLNGNPRLAVSMWLTVEREQVMVRIDYDWNNHHGLMFFFANREMKNMIIGPRSEALGPDRQRECQEQLDVPLLDLVDKAVAAGWKAPEVFDALGEVVRNRRHTHARDTQLSSNPQNIDLSNTATDC